MEPLERKPKNVFLLIRRWIKLGDKKDDRNNVVELDIGFVVLYVKVTNVETIFIYVMLLRD